MKERKFSFSNIRRIRNAFQNPKITNNIQLNLNWIAFPKSEEGLFLDQKGLSVLRMTRPNYTADPTITVFFGKPWHFLFPVPLYWVTDKYVRDETENRWLY